MSEIKPARSRALKRDADVLLMKESDLTWRHDGMGRLLNVAVRRMQARVIGSMHSAGYADMRLAYVNLTRNLDLDGNTITELANRAVMTKQAMGELAEQCEKIGIVERTVDPGDRRVRIIKFTPHGLTWLRELGESVLRAEDEMIDLIGHDAFETLKKTLKTYNKADLPALDPEWTGPVLND